MYEFLRAAGIRAFRTFLQTLVTALLAVSALDKLDLLTVLFAALFAAVVSVITSLVSLPELERGWGGPAGLAVSSLWRAVRTAAQSALGVIGAAAAFSEVDWRAVLMVSGLSAATSFLTGVLEGLPEAPESPGPVTA